MIEQVIIDLTKAIVGLTAELTAHRSPAPAPLNAAAPTGEQIVTPPVTAAASAADAEAPTKRTRRTKEQIAADKAAEKPAATEATTETPTITLAELRGLQSKLMDEGHIERVKGLNAALGVKRIGDLPPEKFAEAHTALLALTAELLKTEAAPAAVATETKAEAPKEDPPFRPTTPANITIEVLKALAIQLRDAGHVEKIKAIINPLGIQKVTETPADKFAAVHEGLTKALADIATDEAV